MANGDWGPPPTKREQDLEQEVKQLRGEVVRLRAELYRTRNKHRYFNPIYRWVDDYLRDKEESE